MQFNPALNEVNTTEHIQGGHGQGACVARASSVVARVTDSCSFLIKQPAVGPELPPALLSRCLVSWSLSMTPRCRLILVTRSWSHSTLS